MTPEENSNPMSGTDYEDNIQAVLQANGFEASKVSKKHGDGGVDIFASTTFKGETFTYNIQCKYYNKTLGKQPIQEVYTGTQYYCNGATPVVFTNNYITVEAREYAKQLGVEIFSQYELQLIKAYIDSKGKDPNKPNLTGIAGILFARMIRNNDFMEQVVKQIHHDRNPEVPENRNELKLQIVSDFDQALEFEKEASKLELQASERRQKAMEIQKRAIIRNIDYG